MMFLLVKIGFSFILLSMLACIFGLITLDYDTVQYILKITYAVCTVLGSVCLVAGALSCIWFSYVL